MNVLLIAQLSPLHIFHNNVKEFRTIVYLVYLNDIWMLQLNIDFNSIL
jgi:hypothetical protein